MTRKKARKLERLIRNAKKTLTGTELTPAGAAMKELTKKAPRAHAARMALKRVLG